MGTREESNVGIVVRGYSGRIFPDQAEGGKCRECGEPVYVGVGSAPVNTVLDRITWIHLGCEKVPPSGSNVPNIIPVGGGNR